MSVWWADLSYFQQLAFVVAATSTIIMFIFLMLTIFGMGNSASFDGGADIDDFDVFNDESFGAIGGLKILTIRGALAFLSIGSWVAFILENTLNPWVASLFGIAAGFAASYLLALAFKATYKLESSGNINFNYAIGKTASVYIRIPKARTGRGKVVLNVAERFVEVEAITDNDQDILSKSMVEVIGLENDTTLIVKIKI